MKTKILFSILIVSFSVFNLSAQEDDGKPSHSTTGKVFRLGIIGTTTSHVNAFINILNDPDREGVYREFEVVGAYAGGMPDNPASWDRVEKIKQFVVEKGINVYPTIEQLLEHIDGALLESVDGRCHLEQAKPVIKAGKPLFIDKPAATTLADADGN
jgi:predicted dehydrogenase